jgi:hypothetical protein
LQQLIPRQTRNHGQNTAILPAILPSCCRGSMGMLAGGRRTAGSLAALLVGPMLACLIATMAAPAADRKSVRPRPLPV